MNKFGNFMMRYESYIPKDDILLIEFFIDPNDRKF